MRAIGKAAAGLALMASLAAGTAVPATSGADTPGWSYWQRCRAPVVGNVTGLRHHDAACRTARRVASRFSLDNPSPGGFRCNSRDRGRYSAVTCAKSPGIAVQVIRFRLTAHPAHQCRDYDHRWPIGR